MPEAFPLQAALQSASDAELLENLTAEQEFPALQQTAFAVCITEQMSTSGA